LRSRFTILLTLFAVALWSAAATADEGALTVFIVRHAEKADTSRDAALSNAGRARAKHLARILRDAEIEHVHSTDFKRTRATAAPSAAAFDIKVILYDPRDVQGLVARLRQSKGRHLVVGHTNTIPKTIELLGGDPGFPIDEASEFDRLYIATVGPGASVNTIIMRYGAQ